MTERFGDKEQSVPKETQYQIALSTLREFADSDLDVKTFEELVARISGIPECLTEVALRLKQRLKKVPTRYPALRYRVADDGSEEIEGTLVLLEDESVLVQISWDRKNIALHKSREVRLEYDIDYQVCLPRRLDAAQDPTHALWFSWAVQYQEGTPNLYPARDPSHGAQHNFASVLQQGIRDLLPVLPVR